MGRLDAISEAVRPKMHGRAMIAGPSGSGKSWTALSMSTVLSESGSVLLIDTERESALTYADVFRFDHLPWRAPYDPTELSSALDDLGDRYEVVIVDSFTHFWRGQGGTLDIADSRFGGWKTARPVQERLVQAVLAVPAHVILTVRSKMGYAVEGGERGTKQTVTKIGMEPMQDEALTYEMNIALDIDLEHRIVVSKSRTPAVPVGRMFPAGAERKAAEDYAEWLAGGIPPAAREDVDEIVGMFDVVDADERKNAKQEFVQRFGMPHSLTAAQAGEAKDWLKARLVNAKPAAAPVPQDAPVNGDSGSEGTTAPSQEALAEAQAVVDKFKPSQVKSALTSRGVPYTGDEDEPVLRKLLVDAMALEDVE